MAKTEKIFLFLKLSLALAVMIFSILTLYNIRNPVFRLLSQVSLCLMMLVQGLSLLKSKSIDHKGLGIFSLAVSGFLFIVLLLTMFLELF